jgi:hypothetical protein
MPRVSRLITCIRSLAGAFGRDDAMIVHWLGPHNISPKRDSMLTAKWQAEAKAANLFDDATMAFDALGSAVTPTSPEIRRVGTDKTHCLR